MIERVKNVKYCHFCDPKPPYRKWHRLSWIGTEKPTGTNTKIPKKDLQFEVLDFDNHRDMDNALRKFSEYIAKKYKDTVGIVFPLQENEALINPSG